MDLCKLFPRTRKVFFSFAAWIDLELIDACIDDATRSWCHELARKIHQKILGEFFHPQLHFYYKSLQSITSGLLMWHWMDLRSDLIFINKILDSKSKLKAFRLRTWSNQITISNDQFPFPKIQHGNSCPHDSRSLLRSHNLYPNS